jgi:CRP-like cAMP-binding protein
VLFREGDAGGSVLALESGRVKVTVATPLGRELLLAVKEPGELLGELSSLDGRPRSATATALEPVQAVAVTSAEFSDFLDDHPRVALGLLRSLAGLIRDGDARVADHATGDTAARLARRLLSLADRFGEHNGPMVEITLDLRQEDLAGWVGATREATSRALAKLRADGCVSTARQRVQVVDAAALRRWADPFC